MIPTRRERRGDGLRQLADLQSEMDRILGGALRGSGARSWSRWSPAADLYETEDAYVVELELPGFGRDDIEVTMEEGILTIAGERTLDAAREADTYHLRERSVGRFSRSFSLPSALDPNEVEARFADGVLIVELPKAVEARPRRIEVRPGS